VQRLIGGRRNGPSLGHAPLDPGRRTAYPWAGSFVQEWLWRRKL